MFAFIVLFIFIIPIIYLMESGCANKNRLPYEIYKYHGKDKKCIVNYFPKGERAYKFLPKDSSDPFIVNQSFSKCSAELRCLGYDIDYDSSCAILVIFRYYRRNGKVDKSMGYFTLIKSD